tara:strand:- start:222 stop:467 length:246 start_codon:yes stop_codon:yes gene_type:complete
MVSWLVCLGEYFSNSFVLLTLQFFSAIAFSSSHPILTKLLPTPDNFENLGGAGISSKVLVTIVSLGSPLMLSTFKVNTRNL